MNAMDTCDISVERSAAETFIEMLEQGKLIRRYNPPSWLGKEGFDDLTSRYIYLHETTLEEDEVSVRESTPQSGAESTSSETQPESLINEPRRFAETYVEAYENGNIPPHWPTPAWLGDPGFEDLTARFLVPVMVDGDEEIQARSASPASEEWFENEECSSFEPSEEQSETEKFPRYATSEQSDDGSDTVIGSSRSSSPALSEQLQEHPTYDEEGENAILSDPDACPALKAMVRSKRSKRYMETTGQVDEATFEQNAQKLYNGFIARAYPDEELDFEELWIEARESLQEALRRHRVRKTLNTARYHLIMAFNAYSDEVGETRCKDRFAEVREALRKIVRLEKGKERYDDEPAEPRILVGWTGMADLIIWEVEDYCWTLKCLDVEVDKEVVEDMKRALSILGP